MSAAAGLAGRRPRDLRLDFFRGLAMFIILLAHTPGNTWTLWIPARFGFSDATEIFVFSSGMASSLAFGAVYVQRSWWLGSARIAFRVWQVYWAHIGVFLVTAGLLFAIDYWRLGLPDKSYITAPYVVPFFENTGRMLVGLFTLTYVPGLFDILPMYLVILAMVPLVMAIHRFAGKEAVFVAVIAIWAAANLGGYARSFGDAEGLSAVGRTLVGLGDRFTFLNLPGFPGGEATWFFNPFGWQIVFFAGFAFGMGWLPAPPVRRGLVIAAAAYVLLTIPFAWFKIHRGLYLPADWALTEWIVAVRDYVEPLIWKSWVGGLRFAHFLALAYLGWVAVGPGGVRLREGWTPPRPAGRWVLAAAAAVGAATVPYTYIDEIRWLWPGLSAWFLQVLPIPDVERLGLLQIAHLAAVIVLGWAAIGATARRWLLRDAFVAVAPVIRKVGTQSLAVFMVSIPLARFDGFVLDLLGRDVWTRLLVNGFGFAVLIGVAYGVGWFKRHPWREPAGEAPPRPAQPAPAANEGRAGVPAE